MGFHPYEDSESSDSWKQKGGRRAPGGWGKGNGELVFNGDRVLVEDGNKFLETDGVQGCTAV